MTTDDSTQIKIKRRIATAARQHRVWQMRSAGMTMPAIAQAEQISVTHVHRIVNRALQELRRETKQEAEEYRVVYLENLRALRLRLWPKALSGDYAAIDRVLRIDDRIAHLLGLDVLDERVVDSAAAPSFVIEINKPRADVIDVTATAVDPDSPRGP